MRPIATPRRLVSPLLLLAAPRRPFAQDDPKPESAYVKLLKKAPEERMGQIVDIIGKRGDGRRPRLPLRAGDRPRRLPDPDSAQGPRGPRRRRADPRPPAQGRPRRPRPTDQAGRSEGRPGRPARRDPARGALEGRGDGRRPPRDRRVEAGRRPDPSRRLRRPRLDRRQVGPSRRSRPWPRPTGRPRSGPSPSPRSPGSTSTRPPRRPPAP